MGDGPDYIFGHFGVANAKLINTDFKISKGFTSVLIGMYFCFFGASFFFLSASHVFSIPSRKSALI